MVLMQECGEAIGDQSCNAHAALRGASFQRPGSLGINVNLAMFDVHAPSLGSIRYLTATRP